MSTFSPVNLRNVKPSFNKIKMRIIIITINVKGNFRYKQLN